MAGIVSPRWVLRLGAGARADFALLMRLEVKHDRPFGFVLMRIVIQALPIFALLLVAAPMPGVITYFPLNAAGTIPAALFTRTLML